MCIRGLSENMGFCHFFGDRSGDNQWIHRCGNFHGKITEHWRYVDVRGIQCEYNGDIMRWWHITNNIIWPPIKQQFYNFLDATHDDHSRACIGSLCFFGIWSKAKRRASEETGETAGSGLLGNPRWYLGEAHRYTLVGWKSFKAFCFESNLQIKLIWIWTRVTNDQFGHRNISKKEQRMSQNGKMRPWLAFWSG